MLIFSLNNLKIFYDKYSQSINTAQSDFPVVIPIIMR